MRVNLQSRRQRQSVKQWLLEKALKEEEEDRQIDNVIEFEC